MQVFAPPSRASLSELPDYVANGLASGKFFPSFQSGLADPDAPTDARNDTPPSDGQIASAGHLDAAALDQVHAANGDPWPTTTVPGGGTLEVTWTDNGPHLVRRYNYFLTRQGWDPTRPLSRSQFDATAFYSRTNPAQPYWAFQSELSVSAEAQSVPLPDDRSGYHVLVAVSETADTGFAYYQVIDLDIA